MNVLDHIVASLRYAGDYNKHDVAAPSVILWTDGPGLWESVASRIGECLERFYILSPEVSAHSGPSTWIRYQLAADAGREGVPVVYLPGVSRRAFRSASGFPEEARHLFALQYLGQFWTQLNGKDWTPAAMLSSADGGLGLDLAKDAATTQALATQLAGVLDTPVHKLQGKRLEAADFNSLAVSDPDGMLLRWMSAPEKVAAEWPPERMAAFREICRERYHFNPTADGPLVAAEKLVAGDGEWQGVWGRFEEAPAQYRGVRDTLAMVQPTDLFSSTSLRLPRTNQDGEDRLRKDLLALTNKPPQEALGQLVTLAHEHRQRAASIWVQLGEAPLAEAATHLGRMAQAIQQALPGTDWASLAKAYLGAGWRVDAEARSAFATVRNKSDMDAVTAALQATYLPWLEKLARRVGAWVSDYPNASKASARQLTVEAGTVYLFVDGLRADLAMELATLLESSAVSPVIAIAWSPLPPVTATAKPGWKPLADALCGDMLLETFEPQLADSAKPLTTDAFRARITGLGIVWFSGAETGDPSGSGWTETAAFDARGHEEGAKLAWRIHEELQVVRHRIAELLQAGWKKVVVITDHGWLWLPGGLPKTELPSHLTESKWSRCAVPQDGATHHLPTAPWFWAHQHHVVLAPGATAFRSNVEYSHGGLTIQETLTPMITVQHSKQAPLGNVAILSHRWTGLRLHVEVDGAGMELHIDVRAKAADAATSLLGRGTPRPAVRGDGNASILIADDDQAGAAATLVLLHGDGVVAKCPVTVGEN